MTQSFPLIFIAGKASALPLHLLRKRHRLTFVNKAVRREPSLEPEKFSGPADPPYGGVGVLMLKFDGTVTRFRNDRDGIRSRHVRHRELKMESYGIRRRER
jgi:hypothetical protein